MKSKLTVRVTFRNEAEKLTNMLTEKFNSVGEAKEAIEFDADYFLNGHRHLIGKKYRQKRGWVNPYTEDYYVARGQDGCTCYWQYFVEH